MSIVVVVLLLLVCGVIFVTAWEVLARDAGTPGLILRVLAAVTGAVFGLIDEGLPAGAVGAVIGFLAASIAIFILVGLVTTFEEHVARLIAVALLVVVAHDGYWMVNWWCAVTSRKIAVDVVNATRDVEKSRSLSETLDESDWEPRALDARPARWLLESRIEKLNKGTIRALDALTPASDIRVYRNRLLEMQAESVFEVAEARQARYFDETWVIQHAFRMVKRCKDED